MAGLSAILLRDRVPGTAHTGTVGWEAGSREASQEEQTPCHGGRGRRQDEGRGGGGEGRGGEGRGGKVVYNVSAASDSTHCPVLD